MAIRRIFSGSRRFHAATLSFPNVTCGFPPWVSPTIPLVFLCFHGFSPWKTWGKPMEKPMVFFDVFPRIPHLVFRQLAQRHQLATRDQEARQDDQHATCKVGPPTRWCPSSLAKLVETTPVNLGLIRGWNIYSSWMFMGIINPLVTGGHHLVGKTSENWWEIVGVYLSIDVWKGGSWGCHKWDILLGYYCDSMGVSNSTWLARQIPEMEVSMMNSEQYEYI